MITLTERYCDRSMPRCAPMTEERGPNMIRALRILIEATK